MEDKTKPSRVYIAVITGLAFLAFIYFLTQFRAETATRQAIAVFGLIAILVECTALEVPSFSCASTSLPVYLSLTILYNSPAAAAIIAFFALALRTMFVNRQSIWNRVIDFSASLLTIMAAVFVYNGVNHRDELLTGLNLAAVAFSILVYFVLDFLIMTTAIGLIDPESQKQWNTIRNRVRFFNVALAPLGLVIAVLCKFADYHNYNLWYAFLLLLPLAAVRYSLEFTVKEFVIKDQVVMEDQIRKLEQAVSAEKEINRALTVDIDRKVEELSIYYEMGHELGESPDLDRTMDIIILMIQKLILYQSCVIFTLEKSNLVAKKAVTPYKDILEMSALLHLKEETVNLVLKNRKPTLIAEMKEREDEQRIFKDERSIMCVPLIIKNELIGVIYVGAQKPGAYNDDKLYQLSILANAAANAIYTAMQYETEKMLKQQREEDLRRVEKEKENRMKLWKLGQDLSNSLSMDTTLQIVVEKMRELVDYQSCVVMLVDHDKQEMRATCFISPYSEYFKSFVLRFDESSLIHLALVHKRTILISDIRKLEEASVLENERCVIVAPLVSENEIIGIVYIGAPEPESIDYEAMELVDEASVQIGMAIKNAQLYEKTMAHAITDGVTGLFTHRYFQERLTQEIVESERNGNRFAVVMVDADHFKQFNDTLGHPEGDRLLKEIASLLKSYAKDEDTVCRYGGDEFTLILKNANKEHAIETAERIKTGFQLRFGVYAVKVTSSIGVAVFPEDGRNKANLMSAVDGAVYRSKRGGRNRVSGATGDDVQLAEDIKTGKVKPLPR